MSGTTLERARAIHEEAELYELAAVKELDKKPTGQKARVWQQHRISMFVNKIAESSASLLENYEDKDGIMKEELQQMRGKAMFTSFYETLKSTREYHTRFQNIGALRGPNVDELQPDVSFSGEEIYGKYLDLHVLHERFCNLPHQEWIEYTTYLEYFYQLDRVIEKDKTRQYRKYVIELWEYLVSFFKRTQPLVDFEEVEAGFLKEFEAAWEANNVPGWIAFPTSISNRKSAGTGPLDLSKFRSAQDLESLGGERLKSALDAIGLKVGGTVAQRAERLWSVRGKSLEEIDPKLRKPISAGTKRKFVPDGPGEDPLAKRMNGQDAEGNEHEAKDDDHDRRKALARMEYKIRLLCEQMQETISHTRKHVEKQQTRTVEEKEAEIEEEEQGLLPDVMPDEEEEEEDDGPLYNPLNLPLGWDGKPIPYWLYKLHGLGVEYKCEICGNQSYWGRRAFDRHFQEWRHAHGMRCLNIPNTKHFHDITLIEDALNLYNKIREQLKVEQFFGADEEEFEDTEGNVLSKKTYEDLARQGLL